MRFDCLLSGLGSAMAIPAVLPGRPGGTEQLGVVEDQRSGPCGVLTFVVPHPSRHFSPPITAT